MNQKGAIAYQYILDSNSGTGTPIALCTLNFGCQTDLDRGMKEMNGGVDSGTKDTRYEERCQNLLSTRPRVVPKDPSKDNPDEERIIHGTLKLKV